MALLNEKGFERKLQQMSLAQDSVQTVSLWIIHHKKYAGDIVKVWTENLKKCSPDRRLVLFYLANDVLQNSRKKGKEFSTAFSKVLKDVIPLLCERKICDSVQRVMKIWHERKVFDKDFLDSLQRKFEASQAKASKSRKPKSSHTDSETEHPAPKHETKVSAKVSESKYENRYESKHESKVESKLVPVHKSQEKKLPPADFKPSHMIDALKAMRDLQAEVTLKESQLNSLRIDASDMEAIKQLKDRSTGAKFTSEYEAATEKLESFCSTLKVQKEEILKLIQTVQDGQLFYDSAFGEVKVIVHAYKTFGNRLNSLKKKVDHKVAKIINEEAEKKKMGPIHTPQASFLTSGLPTMSGDDEKPSDTTVDNTEVADMDLDDDNDSENGERNQSAAELVSKNSTESKTTTTNSSVSQTVSSTTVSATTTTLSAPSSVNTSLTGSTSTVASIPVQMAPVQPPVIMQQPHFQFIPGQPGMPMIPVGMPGSGQFISIPSQYPQPLVPYGMGMHAMGTFPGQPQLTTIQIPGQTPFPGVVPNISPAMPSNAPASQITVNTSTPINQAGLPGQSSVVPLAQPAPKVNAETIPTQSVIKPLPSLKLPPRRQSIGSPSSEMSAPSPIGSPELQLGGDETPETASPQRVDDVKIIAMSDQQRSKGQSNEDSLPSTGTNTPNRTSESSSEPVNAVNILAKLISRGRQLKEETPDIESGASAASTPKEDQPETTQTQDGKPLFTLIDSLFPKLTDSLKTLREREKDNETSTSTSEEGSPKQKIEINSMGDNDDSENEGDPMIRPKQHTADGHSGPMGYGPSLGNPRVPFPGQPSERPHGQVWNEERFPNHLPPFREYQERPQIPPASPVKGPGLSPRFAGPHMPFQGPPGAFPGESREEFIRMPQRSPRQSQSPRAQSRPIDLNPDMDNGPPNSRSLVRPISPRGGFISPKQKQHFEEHSREDQGPQFRFENSGLPPRPGPPDVHRMPLGGSPQRPHLDGRPKPSWLGRDGPRPYHRSFSDGEVGETPGEPPIKRPTLEDGAVPRPSFHPPSPGFERNREMWGDRERWEPRHPGHGPDFHSREGHLSPRFMDHNRPFPPRQERPSFPPRRNSFKGFEHFPEHRPRSRFPFRGGHQRPFY